MHEKSSFPPSYSIIFLPLLRRYVPIFFKKRLDGRNKQIIKSPETALEIPKGTGSKDIDRGASGAVLFVQRHLNFEIVPRPRVSHEFFKFFFLFFFFGWRRALLLRGRDSIHPHSSD